MMYKIEGEDLYLIGTSEHSMIGKYIDTINGLAEPLQLHVLAVILADGHRGVDDVG